MILVTAVLCPEIRNIPRRKEKRVGAFSWNEAVFSLSPLPQSRDFRIGLVVKFKFRFGEFGHGLRWLIPYVRMPELFFALRTGISHYLRS